MLRPAFIALLTVTALVVVSPGLAHADGDFTITVENGEVDVPDRTTEIGGQEFTVTSVAPIEPGEPIEAHISMSGDDPYDVFLYNSDGVPDGRELGVSGETTATFETSDLEPGTYSVVVSTDRFETIQPVVITAYDTTLSVPSEVTEGEHASVAIETSEHDGVNAPAIERVEAVVANDSTQYRIEASETGDGEYVADIGAEYEPGEYRLYGVVYEDEEVENGELNVISMSDEHTVTVIEQEENDGDGGEDGTDEDAGSPTTGGATPTAEPGDDDESEDSTETATNDSEETDAGNGTDSVTDDGANATTGNETDSSVDNGTGSSTDNETDSSADNEADSTDESETDGRTIQPNDSDDVPESSESVPLNGVQIIVVTLLSIAFVVRVRHGCGK